MILPNLEVPIIVRSFSDHERVKPNLLRMLKNQKHSIIYNSYDRISKSDFFVDINQSREYIEYFFPFVYPFIQKICVNELDIEDFSPSFFKNFWFQEYHYNDTHHWHRHHGCSFNVVYYLELPDSSVSTELKSPLSDIIYKPEVNEGDILIFPSFFIHRSPPNQTKQRKTVIAFNLT